MSRRLISFEAIAEGHPCFMDIDYRADWAGLFENSNPVKLEVGFGSGNFLIEMALREPNSNFVGMDFYHKGIRKTITRIDKYQLKNVRIVYGDAREKIPVIFGDGGLSTVYINFPDPWPKKRHIKRRLIQPEFVQVLADKIEPGGEVLVATDSEPYARQILEVFEAEPRMKNKSGTQAFLNHREDIPKSKYEKAFLGIGEIIYYLTFIKE